MQMAHQKVPSFYRTLQVNLQMDTLVPAMKMRTNMTVYFRDVQSFIEFLLDPDRAFRQRYMFRSVGDLDLEGVTLLSGGVPSKDINTVLN